MTSASAPSLLTVAQIIARSTEYLRAKGCASPRLDAELLLGEVLGLDRLRLYLAFDRPLDAAEQDRMRELLRRRGAREPVATILGRRDFRHLTFHVTRDVLIPRPETEQLVTIALEELAARAAGEPPHLLEIGIGSGAIALSLLHEHPTLRVTATDCSAAALDVARTNAERFGLTERLALHHQDHLAELSGPFDAIVTNPPYVPETDRPTLAPEVLNHEPDIAVFSGPDGLDCIRMILAEGAPLLRPGGFVLLEMGASQGPAVLAEAGARGWQEPRIIRDDAGRDRFLHARRAT